MTGVSNYYDDYVERQLKVGINARHRAIIQTMREAGWQEGHRVLEIGAGIGTLTELIAEGLGTHGSLVGLDLSPRSIEVAKHRLERFSRVRMLAADVLDASLDGVFDIVVLPDVIEHIPLELHGRLFERIARWLADDGVVILNYPNPYYLAWCHEHKPHELQLIDQPVYTDVLVPHIYACGLYIDQLETYSLWIREGDYVRMTLRPRHAARSFTEIPEAPPSLSSRILQLLWRPKRG
jgi:trans-aconitate 2-methyltransferase